MAKIDSNQAVHSHFQDLLAAQIQQHHTSTAQPVNANVVSRATDQAIRQLRDRFDGVDENALRALAEKWNNDPLKTAQFHLAKKLVEGTITALEVTPAELLASIDKAAVKTGMMTAVDQAKTGRPADLDRVANPRADVRDGHLEYTLYGAGSMYFDDAVRLLTAKSTDVRMSPTQRDAMQKTREQTLERVAEGDGLYGWDAGVGPRFNLQHDLTSIQKWQADFVRSHRGGSLKETYPDETARGMLLLRAHVLSGAEVGVRPELVERMLDVFNAGIVPVIPKKGSQGSGDMPAMAALAGGLMGLDGFKLKYKGEVGPAKDILAKAGLDPAFALDAGEALAMVSGSTAINAGALTAAARLDELIDVADGAFALTYEALSADIGALDERTHDRKNDLGQQESAAKTKRLLSGSTMVDNVMDPTQLRSSTAVHGTLRNQIKQGIEALTNELNACSNNPLLALDADGNVVEALKGGNYDGTRIADLIDTLNTNVIRLGQIVNQRVGTMTNPNSNKGIPYGALPGPVEEGFGYVNLESESNDIAARMQMRSNPASVHVTMTKAGGREGYASNGNNGLLQLTENVADLERILACETLMATQAIDVKHNIPTLLGALKNAADKGDVALLTQTLDAHPRFEAMLESDPALLEGVQQARGSGDIEVLKSTIANSSWMQAFEGASTDEPPSLGTGTQAIFDVVRGAIPLYQDQTSLGDEIDDAESLVRTRQFVDTIRANM